MSGRVEIITGPERRRRWSEEEKLQLVEEACRPGHSVSQVARQRGINASQLFAWRRQALAKGLVSDNRPSRGCPALTFAPVKVTEEPAPADVRRGGATGTATKSFCEDRQASRSSSRAVIACVSKAPPMLLWSRASSPR